MQDNSSLSVLIIDPSPGMRASLQNMLLQSRIGKIEFAVSSGTAIKLLARKSFDIILCEYDLDSGGEQGQDGQQLLEDLRHHKLIGLWTIFIMITSEGVYGKVVSAAELTPTDYILKPFTAEMLSARIARALARRAVFLPAWQLIAQGQLRAAASLCATAETAHPRYAPDLLRLRAELHMSLNDMATAEQLYAAILAAKPVGWATLGLARTLFAQDRIEEAATILTQLLALNPKLMAAYDLLARCHEAGGATVQAQKTLEEAVAISPHMVRRLRRLGEVALEAGDVAVAEKSFRQVVAKARYSEFRDPEDHVNLVKALVGKGDAAQASGVIRDLEKSMRGNVDADACKAISNALLHEAAGNAQAAIGELTSAVSAARASSTLSARLKIGLARSCLSNRLDSEASQLMLSLMNDAGSGVSMQQAIGVFVNAGRPDLADGMGVELKAQALALLGVAHDKTALGDFKGAVQALLEALHMAPNNVQALTAAITGILRQIDELGWDHPLAETCHIQIDTLRKLDPAHPQLAALDADYQAARRKYGIAG